MNTNRRTVLRGAALAAASLARLPAFAQSAWPEHPIKLIVPFPAGALTDTLGRLMADRLRPVLGQPVVVENKPGAGTLLGASVVARSAPDGYTLMVATTTTLAISPAMQASPPATPSEFVGVGMIGSVSLLLVARPDFPARNLPELVAAIRREPGRLNFGSPGSGTMHHLVVEMLKGQEKLQAAHVPYQGSMAALNDLLTGRIDFMFLDAVAALPQVQAGKLKVIAICGAKRLPNLPEVATVAESYPTLDMQAWQSIAAPKATPAAIVARLNAEMNKLLETAEVRAALQKVGVEALPMSVQALNELIARDERRFADMVRASGLRAT